MTRHKLMHFLRIAFWMGVAGILPALVGGCAGLNDMAYGDIVTDVQHHAATTQASVTDTSVNGFGGDPLIDYHFRLGSIAYRGSGPDGKLGNPLTSELHPGDVVTVRYSSLNPRHSCTCAPSTDETTMTPDWAFHTPDLLYFAPLVAAVLAIILGATSRAYRQAA